jgi:chlorobactene glucosyltransferase
VRDLLTILCGLTTFYWWVHLAAAIRRMVQRDFLVTVDTHALPPVDEQPTVSVLIPARDEAAAIQRCLESVLAQDHAVAEVIVLDDRSTDGTGDIVDALARSDDRLRRIVGRELPGGWKGKNWALHQAVAEARGEWLLFVDADVQLSDQAVRQALGAARAHGAQMVSWFAQLEMRTFWERQLMPFIADFIVLFSPLHKVNDPAEDHCIANGQFILIRREVYDEVGGHAAIRGTIIDDVGLARAVKFAGFAMHMAFALGLMQTRMYASFGQIWRGWSKNFFPAMQQRPGLAVGAVAYLALTGVVPPLLAVWAVVSAAGGRFGAPELLALSAAAGIVVYRTVTRWVDPGGYGWAHVLLHPLQALVLSGIIVDSVLQSRGNRSTRWKGRTYGKG